jgi:DNA polymerase-3 subunit gamma/tau
VREALGLVPEDEFIAILDIIGSHRAGEIFTTVNRLADAGVDFGVFLAGFADILRAQLTVVLSGKADGVSTTAAASLAERKNLFSAGDLLRMISAINALEPTFRKSGQQQLLVEMLLVRMALLDRTVLLEDRLAGLGNAADASAPSGGSAGVGAVRSAPANPPATAVARSAARPPNATPRHPAPPVRPISVAAPSSPPDWAPAPTQAATDASVQEMKRAMESTARDTNRSRMTPEALREERLGVLRQKDPGLGAAIDALDLELLD